MLERLCEAAWRCVVSPVPHLRQIHATALLRGGIVYRIPSICLWVFVNGKANNVGDMGHPARAAPQQSTAQC